MEYLGHEYVEIGGIKWATCNIGANSITDTGLYFQWGDTQGYTASQVGGAGQKYFGWEDYKYGNGTSSPGATGMTKYNASDGKTVLEASDDVAQVNWGGSWRMPTTAEYVALGNAVNTAWTADYQGSGVAGMICTDKTDSSKVLFFPACGRYYNGSVGSYGGRNYGYYLSSSLYSGDVQYSLGLNFAGNSVTWQNGHLRHHGLPVRGVFTGEPEDLTREELNYSSNAAAVYEENQYTLPVLTNVHNLELTYNSSDTNVATINSSGIVSIVGNGTTTISATFAGNSDYNAKTINYVLIVDIKKYLDYKGLETFKQQLDIEFNKKANSSTVQGIIDDIGDNSTLNSIKGRIKVIEDKIPSAASSDNQLADKNFVNSSVATNTATYKGNYNVVSDLELSYNSTHLEIAQALALEISLADNNDYCFVLIPTSNSSPEEIKVIERYKFDGTNWNYEYSLNNSGFTSDLWKAINSGITSGLITTFNNKYDKPSGGIPKTDLSSTVQSSLDKADTALQLHQDISGKADKIATVSNVAYDGTNKKITKTINGITSDVVAASTLKSDMELNNVTNDAQVKRSEMGEANGVATLDEDGHLEAEQLEGDYPNSVSGNVIGEFSDSSEVSFRPTAGAVDVNSGKASKGAKLMSVKGNTIAWNQFIYVSSASRSETQNGVTLTDNRDGTYSVQTITGGASSDVHFMFSGSFWKLNHIYYIGGCPSGGSFSTYNFSTGYGGDTGNGAIFNNSHWSGYNSWPRIIISANVVLTTPIVFKPMIIDLTLIYGEGNEPETVAEFEADYQRWFGKPLTYEDYDAGSLRPVKMTGIKTVGFNQGKNYTNGTNMSMYATALYAKIDVIPNKQYTITFTGVAGHRFYINENIFNYQDFEATGNRQTIIATSLPNLNLSKGTEKTIFKNITSNILPNFTDVCISLHHSGARDGEYEPYWSSMLNVPVTTLKGKLNGEGSSVTVFPDGMKKAGTVYDEIVRRGDKTYAIKRVGSVDMGDFTWVLRNGKTYIYEAYSTSLVTDKKRADVTDTGNILCGKYTSVSYVNLIDNDIANSVSWTVNDISNIIIVNDPSYVNVSPTDFKTAMNGIKLYYELETPEEYLLDDFELPQNYDVDDYGTEEVQLGTNGCAPVLDIKYGINVGDTIKNLPHSYVSAVGEQNFTEAQKARARKNIGVISQEQLDALTRRTRKSDFSFDVLKQAVADQNLEKYGLKVGDYKTINGHDYVIAGLNTMRGLYSPYRLTTNHVGLIVIPHTTQAWNVSGNTYQSTYTYATDGSTWTAGAGAGYANSDLHHYMTETLLPIVKTDLGSYASGILKHHKLYSNAINTSGYNRYGSAGGCSSSWAWYENQEICALSEVQVYGSVVWSSSGYDTGEACRQLDVFRVYNMNEIFGWEYPWLRDVTTASYACYANYRGYANSNPASYASYVAGLILFN